MTETAIAISPEGLRQILARNIADAMHRMPGLDTQLGLAAKAKIGQSHLSRILRGESAATIDRVAKIAKALGMQPWELLVDTELTRRAALERMIVGATAPNERVAKALGKPVNRKRK